MLLGQALEDALGMPLFKSDEAQQKYLQETEIGAMQTERERIGLIAARLAAKTILQTGSAKNDFAQRVARTEEQLPASEQTTLQLARRRLSIIHNFEDYWQELSGNPAQSQLRPHQIDGLEMFYDFLIHRDSSDVGFDKRGFYNWATGTGKTVLIAKIAEACGIGSTPQDGSGKPLRALVLAPRQRIMNQILGTAGQGGFERFAPKLRVGFLRALLPEVPNDVDVSSYYGLVRRIQDNPDILSNYDLIFCDEAHTSLGVKTAAILDDPKHQSITLGFTASTKLTKGKEVANLLKHQIHDIPFLEAIEERGIINGFEFYWVNTMRRIVSDDGFVSQHGDFGPSELREFIFDDQINGHIAELTKLFVEQGKRGIVFCMPGQGSVHARMVARKLRTLEVAQADGETRTVNSRAVGYFLPDAVSHEHLADFDNGKMDVITTTQLLELGWDSDKVDFIILAAPTLSQAKMIQRIGRGARLKASGESTIVVQFDYATGKLEQVSPFDLINIPRFDRHQGYRVLNHVAQKKDNLSTTLQKTLRNLLGTMQLEIERTHKADANRLGYNPEHIRIDDLATELDTTADYIRTILFGQKLRVYRAVDPETGNYFSLCDADSVTFLRENFAQANEHTIQDIAKMYDIPQSFVTHKLNSLGLYRQGKQRIPRVACAGGRAMYFDSAALAIFDKDFTETSLPLQQGEVSVAEIGDETGVSPTTIMRWLQSHPKRATQIRMRRPKAGVGNQSNRPVLDALLAAQALERFKLLPMDESEASLHVLPARLLQKGNGYIFDILDEFQIQPVWRRGPGKRRILCISKVQREQLIATWQARRSTQKSAAQAVVVSKPAPQKVEPIKAVEMVEAVEATEVANTIKVASPTTPAPTPKAVTKADPELQTRRRTVLQPSAETLVLHGARIKQGMLINGQPLLALAKQINMHAQHIIDIIEQTAQWEKAVIRVSKTGVVYIPSAIFSAIFTLDNNRQITRPPLHWRTLSFMAAKADMQLGTARHILDAFLESGNTITVQVTPHLNIVYYSPAAYEKLRTQKYRTR